MEVALLKDLRHDIRSWKKKVFETRRLLLALELQERFLFLFECLKLSNKVIKKVRFTLVATVRLPSCREEAAGPEIQRARARKYTQLSWNSCLE